MLGSAYFKSDGVQVFIALRWLYVTWVTCSKSIPINMHNVWFENKLVEIFLRNTKYLIPPCIIDTVKK